MSLLHHIYSKNLIINEQQRHYWEDYLDKLRNLDFKVFSEKLKIPALIPIGSKILFRGELKHTNEITVALGADYFTKCSVKQAEILRRHRISEAESKLALLIKEKEYIENQLTFTKDDTIGQEIIEDYNEADEKIWRERHKENLRKHALNKKDAKIKDNSSNNVDKDIWEKLEELELQEDLRNELEQKTKSNSIYEILEDNILNKNVITPEDTHHDKHTECKFSTYDSDMDIRNMLSKALNKQNELELKLQELKDKDRSVSKTEKDIISRMDELEELDELEDEINRLDELLNENIDAKEKQPRNITKEKVSFISEEDYETLELTFSHSKDDPVLQPYNPNIGIQKPSDIYEAHKLDCKPKQTKSILKKTKYEISSKDNQIQKEIEPFNRINYDQLKNKERNAIVINDITETTNIQSDKMDEDSGRRPSLFKKKRLLKNK